MELKILDISRLSAEQKRAENLTATVDGGKYMIQTAEQKTGFGTKRFFLCPECEKRKTRLYFFGNGFRCASCGGINPYRGIQNGTESGERELAYRMMRFAAANGIRIKSWPFNYLDYMDDRRINRGSFRKKIAILQALENLRFQNIFFKRVYSQGIIRAVLKGEHPAVKKLSLWDLKESILDFDEFR